MNILKLFVINDGLYSASDNRLRDKKKEMTEKQLEFQTK